MSFPRIEKLDKNFIINGNFDFWQRGLSAVNGTGYLADRFLSTYSTGSMTASRSTDVPVSNAPYSLQIAGTAATNPQIQHRIEDVFAKELASKAVTFKVRYKVTDSTGVPLKLLIYNPTTNNNYNSVSIIQSSIINAAPTNGVWSSFVITVMMPGDANKGIGMTLFRDSGATPATTTTLFSQIQLALGDMKDLEFCYAGRNMAQELILCQRYYEKSFASDVYPVSGVASSNFIIMGTYGDSAGQHYFSQKFAVVKRAVPITTVYAINGVTGQIQYLIGAGGEGNASTNSVSTDAVVQFRAFSYSANAASRAAFNYTADAEL